MRYARKYGLQPGDAIVEPIFQTGITKHFSLYLGVDAAGTEWIAENYKWEAVRIVPAEQYFHLGRKVERIEKFNGDSVARRKTIQRALALVGKPYDLVSYNCEHYVNEVLTGKSESKQVDNIVLGLLTVLIVGAIVKA